MTRRTQALVALVLTACTGSSLPVVTASDVVRAQARWTDATQADLEHGRELLVARCSGCHLPPPPRDHAQAQWPAFVDEMRERSHLADAEATAIERYLVTFAAP